MVRCLTSQCTIAGLDALEGEKRKDETVRPFGVYLQQIEAINREPVQHGPERHALYRFRLDHAFQTGNLITVLFNNGPVE